MHSLFNIVKHEEELALILEDLEQNEEDLRDLTSTVVDKITLLKKDYDEIERDLNSIDANSKDINVSINRNTLNSQLRKVEEQLRKKQMDLEKLNQTIREKEAESYNLKSEFNNLQISEKNILNSIESLIGLSADIYADSIENSYDTHVFNTLEAEVAKLICDYKTSFSNVENKHKNDSNLDKTIRLIHNNIIKSRYEESQNVINGEASFNLLNAYNLYKSNNNDSSLFELLEEFGVLTQFEYEIIIKNK